MADTATLSQKNLKLLVSALDWSTIEKDVFKQKRLFKVYCDLADKNGYTLLHMAVVYEKKRKLKKIISLGYNVNAQTNNGLTAITIAAKQGVVYSVKQLLGAGADPSIEDDQGLNAMHFAIIQRRKPIIELLKDKMDLMTLNKHGYTTLEICEKYARWDILERHILDLENVNTIGHDGVPVFFAAVKNGIMPLIMKFLALNVNVNLLDKNGRNALFYTTRFDIVQMLFRSGINVNVCCNGITPVFHAATNGVYVLVKYYIGTCKADINLATPDILSALEKEKRIALYSQRKADNFTAIIRFLTPMVSRTLNKKYNDSFCGICLEPLAVKYCFFQCGHPFHIECAQGLLSNGHGKCPSCRLDL